MEFVKDEPVVLLKQIVKDGSTNDDKMGAEKDRRGALTITK